MLELASSLGLGNEILPGAEDGYSDYDGLLLFLIDHRYLNTLKRLYD